MSFEDKQQVCADCQVIATKAERERIIKMLKRNSSELGWIQLDIDQLIKAIEGKSK